MAYDKKEYCILYNKTNRKRFALNLSLTEYDNFLSGCTKMNVVPSALLKRLVNEEFERKGLSIPFINAYNQEKYKRKEDGSNKKEYEI